MSEKETVNHPKHYGGEDNAWEYISRVGKKDPVEDLKKSSLVRD